MLYLIATPIGNLGDLSIRAIEILKKMDLILCEDTRQSSRLLNRYEIVKKLSSHHKFNEKQNLLKIVDMLRDGKEIALLSDAGTPCINDPGSLLVQECIKEKIPFTLIPGPCSLISALVLSGFDLERFQYIGFLPKKGILQTLQSILCYPGATVALESPERIAKTLEVLKKIDGTREIAIVREMTKVYEECIRGSVEEVLNIVLTRKVLGEICLVIGPKKDFSVDSIEPEELISELQNNFGVDLKKAISMAAHLLKKPKRDIYKKIHAE